MLKDGQRLMVFSGTANPGLGQEIAQQLGTRLGEVEISRFADSEIYVRFIESVRGAHVFVIQSLCQPVNDNLMELLIMIDALKRASAGTISAVIPYYGYSRQDKKTVAREPITAKLVADLLTVAGSDRVLTMDLHAGSIQGFFDLPVDHLTALPIIADHFQSKGLEDVVVVSPDVGRVKTAKKLADTLGAHVAVLAKRRPPHSVVDDQIQTKAEVTHIIGDVKDKDAIMIDDMIDTGGTICRGADTLKKAGAKDIYAACTHAVFSGSAIENLKISCIKEMVVTNTVPMPIEKFIDKISVLSVGPIFATTIQNVFEDRSISEIFGGTDHV